MFICISLFTFLPLSLSIFVIILLSVVFVKCSDLGIFAPRLLEYMDSRINKFLLVFGMLPSNVNSFKVKSLQLVRKGIF
jgi:hypothetical protein